MNYILTEYFEQVLTFSELLEIKNDSIYNIIDTINQEKCFEIQNKKAVKKHINKMIEQLELIKTVS